RQGQQALKDRNNAAALDYFKQAHELRDQLDPSTAQRLQDYLQMLAVPPGSKGPVAKDDAPAKADPPLLDNTTSQKNLMTKQLLAELAQKEVAAGKIRAKDPKRAVEMLKEARATIEASGLPVEDRGQLLRRVDRKLADLDKFITDNKAELELDEANR